MNGAWWQRWRLLVRPRRVEGFLSIYVLLYLAEAPIWLIWHDWSHVHLSVLRLIWVGMVLVTYGIYRGTFHPGVRKSHGQWLSLTPWRAQEMALPLGPAHLVWEDAVVCAWLWLIGWWESGGEMSVMLAAMLFLGPYVMTLALVVGRSRPAGWVFLFSLPLMLWPQPRPVVILCAIVVNYLLLWPTLWWDLRRFPWYGESWRVDQVKQYRKAARNEGLIAWPLDAIGPEEEPEPVHWINRVLVVLLTGWWVMTATQVCVWWNSTDAMDVRLWWRDLAKNLGQRHGMEYVGLLFALFLALIRLVPYVKQHRPPIGWWGRWLTGRWVIPGYDVVFVTPVLMVLTGWWLPVLWVRAGLPVQMVTGVTAGALVALMTMAGPSMRRWRLTGRHRAVAVKPRKRGQIVVDLNSDVAMPSWLKIPVNLHPHPAN